MSRPLKLLVALGLALTLHAALLLLGAPRVEELASPLTNTADTANTTDTAEASAATTDVQPTTVTQPSDPQKPLDVGWDAPPEAPAPRPTPPPVLLAKTPPVPVKPVAAPPAPQAVVAAKPKPQTVGNRQTTAVVTADTSYANLVRQHLGRYAGALPPGANGEARVQFVVQPDGQVSDVRLVRQSGHAGLDSIALNLPTMAQPLPLPGAQAQRLEVPVQAVAVATP